ncbi:tripartite motif-containing protein 16-like [Synchiropus splendidus]|uniref:tripartite motif-containing protein 16-like n=1 Tax=Synchiropus splendidus TaxID=270530 RepID=UPI00237DAFCA|nr:tripartite motif-containing protein 16-like [Synchiropus splendidus]
MQSEDAASVTTDWIILLHTPEEAGLPSPFAHSLTGLEDRDINKCPQCRQSFTPRPLLQKNIVLAQLVEELKKTGHQAADLCYAGPEDVAFICSLCAVDHHKDHNIVSAAAERREREKDMDQCRGRIQQRIQEREEDMRLLQQEEKNIIISADRAVRDSQIFSQLNIRRRMPNVEQQIRSRQQTEAAQIRGLQEQLELEIAELKKKDAELQQLLQTDSYTMFLQSSSSLSRVSEDTLSSSTHVRPRVCFEEVLEAMSARDRLQDILRHTWTKCTVMLSLETRAQFLRYSRDITLDPNAAHSGLLLSEGNRRVTFMAEAQSPPHHPDRFTDHPQVLSKEALTGRCYWEVEGTGEVEVAVAYKTISRSGEESRLGVNDNSWSLRYETPLLSSVPSSRVGVYLDHCAGLLSFYSLSESMTLLCRVQTSFTQPLHAGVWSRTTCEFLKLN